MASGKSNEQDKSNPYAQLYLTNARYASNLHHWLTKRAEQVRYYKIVPKRSAGFYAILGITDDNGEQWTAFGSGIDYIEAVRSLNATVAASKWKPEKFPTR